MIRKDIILFALFICFVVSILFIITYTSYIITSRLELVEIADDKTEVGSVC